MSRSLNRVELIGHLGKDCEMKFTPDGTAVGQFSIATSRRWQDKKTQEWKEETDWHRCVYWRCENVAKFLTKGKQVFVSGRLRTRDYEDRDGVKRYVTEVTCEDVILLGGGEGGARPPHPADVAAAPANATGGQGITDDDVPF